MENTGDITEQLRQRLANFGKDKEGEAKKETTTPETVAETKAADTKTAEEAAKETADETTELSVEEKNKLFLEKLKIGDAEPPKEPAPLPTEVQAQLADYERLKKDPLVQAILQEGTKEDLVKIALEMNGKDYSKHSYADLIRLEVAATPGITEADIQEEMTLLMAEFDAEPSKYKKAAMENALRQKFQQTSKGGESATLMALAQKFEEKQKLIPTEASVNEQNKKIAELEKGAIAMGAKQAIGSSFNGVEFTEADAQKVIDSYDFENMKAFLTKDGHVDVQKFVSKNFQEQNFERMVTAEVDRRVKAAQKESAVTIPGEKKSPITPEQVDARKQNLKGMGMSDLQLNQASILMND